MSYQSNADQAEADEYFNTLVVQKLEMGAVLDFNTVVDFFYKNGYISKFKFFDALKSIRILYDRLKFDLRRKNKERRNKKSKKAPYDKAISLMEKESSWVKELDLDSLRVVYDALLDHIDRKGYHKDSEEMGILLPPQLIEEFKKDDEEF